VLGIVVDDAIVVGENINKEHERGTSGAAGAIRGVQGVSVPVVFAVLTSVIAFVPMLALPGTMGKFMGVIPMTVIPALLFSLVESQLILPAHLSHESRFTRKLSTLIPFRWWVSFQSRVSGGLGWLIDRVFRPVLTLALNWRYATISVGLASLFLTVGLVRGGLIKFDFFPDVEGDVISAQLTMPEGTSAVQTARAVAQLEEAAGVLRVELEEDGEEGSRKIVRNFMASIGEQPYLAQKRGSASGPGGIVGSHYGELVIELIPAEDRQVTSLEVMNRWREIAGPVPGVSELTFSSALMHAGDPIHVRFAGHDIEELRRVAEEFKGALSTYTGVFDAKHNYKTGKDELQLDVEPAAEALGLSRLDLARQVRQGFYGEEAQRIQRGRDEVKVMVRYPEEDRRTLHGLESMRIRTRDGGEVPFSAVARAERRKGYSSIQRTDRRRTIDVTANVDRALATPNEILGAVEEDVLPSLLAAHPSVSYSLEGQTRDQADTLKTGGRYLLLALIAMYGLMAIPFRSYLQPAIIMLAIPFGIVGAIVGHMIMGINLCILSLMGILALAGVVVNDSLVLVDFVNRNRREGASLVEAARLAAISRFRPILLTSMTTFAGLTPLLLERSIQAQFLVPMAVSLAFGIVFSTVISLLLVPSAYLILEDLRRAIRWLYGTGDPVPAGEGTEAS
jgi:multidrug efflux pump subunit AcrB